MKTHEQVPTMIAAILQMRYEREEAAMVRSSSMIWTGEPVGRRDLVIAAALSLIGLWAMYKDTLKPGVNVSDLAIPVFLAVTVPLVWRRAAPLAALSAELVALAAHVVLFGEMVRCGIVFPVTWILVFAASARLERRPALTGLLLGVGCVFVMASDDGRVSLGWAVPFAVVTVFVWGTGRLARSRSRLAAELQGRTEELRAVRDERARLEVATDRARLSGELDELLQRRLGELAKLADVGAGSADSTAATATLVSIEHESRKTLEEMRDLVGALRSHEEASGPVAPQPTLTALDAMIVQSKGAAARLTVDGNPRALPAGVELSAYRIVEHLLGALDDAPGVDVRVCFGESALEVAVAGPTTRRRDIGAAIKRARERAQLHRGTLQATVEGGRARAIAELPLVAEA
jgi:signal transduction histidine kinase